MPIELTGRCRVSGLREGAAREHGTLRVWQHAGRESGAAAISLRILELARGRSPSLGGAACDEVLYVFEGDGALLFEAGSRPIGTDTAFYVPPRGALPDRGFHADDAGQLAVPRPGRVGGGRRPRRAACGGAFGR